MKYIQVITTTENREQARVIAQCLVEKELAACVQIAGPIESVYRWKENLESAREYLCLIKTCEDLFPEVEETIKKHHTYEVPEIIAVPIIGASDAYIRWMSETLKES